MTTFRLWPGNPALAASSYSGPFEAGITWQVTQGGMWLQGYWWYVPAGGATSPQEFCLYCLTSSSAGTLMPAATVTSGALTAGTWNYVPLAAPVPVAIATPYMAATGFTANGTFASQSSQFGTGGPYVSGLANGPLTAFSDATGGGTLGTGNPWGGMPQGTFGTASADPTAHMPVGGSNSASFGLDVQVSTVAPPGYRGPWSLYPGTVAARAGASPDTAVPYGVAVEVACTAACTVTAIRYYSPSAATVLASWCGVWDVATTTCIGEQLSPSWSGAAGSGWVAASLPAPVTLVPGRRYKLQVNVTVSSVATLKDAADPWGPAGSLSGGIASGPVTAVPLATASSAWNYSNNAAGSPPYSDGTAVTHAQSTFSQTVAGYSGRPPYPLLWANAGTGSGTQDYFVDGVFYNLASSGLLMAAGIT